jgi:hypothetical protein
VLEYVSLKVAGELFLVCLTRVQLVGRNAYILHQNNLAESFSSTFNTSMAGNQDESLPENQLLYRSRDLFVNLWSLC